MAALAQGLHACCLMWEEAPAAFGGNSWENTETTCRFHIKGPQTGSNAGTEGFESFSNTGLSCGARGGGARWIPGANALSLASVTVIEVSLVNGLETEQPLAPLSPRFTTKAVLFAFLMVKYGLDSGNGRPGNPGGSN